MIKKGESKHIISALFGLAIILLPFLSREVSGMFRNEVSVLYAIAGMLAAGFACLTVKLFRKSRSTVNIISIDILLLIFSGWYVINFFIRSWPLTDWWPLIALAFFLLAYILGRQIKDNTIVLGAILLSGTLQAAVAAGQIFGITGTQSWMYDVTGSFGGPAFLGMLLALAMVAGTELLIKARLWSCKIVIIVLMIFIGFVLIHADSRTSWIAAIAGVCYLILGIPRIRQRIGLLWARSTVKFALLAIVVTCCAALYFYKKDSADGRLLIWRISAGMIADNPITGVGVGKFPAEYMKYQALYFEKHPDSKFSELADNISYPYNEFLRILCELGLIGGILVLAVAWVVLKNNRYIPILICWVVLAMFSFPASLPVAIAILALSLNGGSVIRSLSINRYFMVILVLFILFAGKITCDLIKVYKAPDIETNNYRLGYSASYIRYAAKQLTREKNTVNLPVLKKYAKIFRTSEFYTDLGLLYNDLGDTTTAKYYLKYASDMVPSRIYPRYCLFELYRDGNQPDSAVIVAKTIINMTPKIENTTTIKTQVRAKEYLEKIKKQR